MVISTENNVFEDGGWLDETQFVVDEAQVECDGMAFCTDDRGREFTF